MLKIPADSLERLLVALEDVVGKRIALDASAFNELRASGRALPPRVLDEVFKAAEILLDASPRTLLGTFIVLSGLDKSGKETQAFNPMGLHDVKPVLRYLEERSFKVLPISLPSYDTLLGSLVGVHLGKRGLGYAVEIVGSLSAEYAWVLWSLDRAQHNPRIKEWLGKGKEYVVLSKRWTESQLAYQKALGIDEGRILRLERNIIQPNHTFVIDIPAEEVLKRATKAVMAVDRYEDVAFLAEVRRNYLDLYRRRAFGKVFLVNGLGSPQEVNLEILRRLGEVGL